MTKLDDRLKQSNERTKNDITDLYKRHIMMKN